MRPLFVNRAPHPVRSRFSAFQFSASKPGTKGVSRAAVNKAQKAQSWSGKTIISIGLKSLPRIHSLKPGNENNISLASQGVSHGHDDEGSLPEESEPWEQNVEAPGGYQEWQLDVMPRMASLESGIRADGSLVKWGVL